VGVSVDAASPETFNKYKGMKPEANAFERIIENIRLLTEYAHKHNNKLGWKHPAYGVSFKYLLYKDNISEIYHASRRAREIGCKNIHFRPAGTTWDMVGTRNEIRFTPDELEMFRKEIALAQSLDCEEFGVFGVTHKFDSQFQCANYFSSCHAVFMTAVFEPPSEGAEDAFILGLCCDRRGDPRLELLHNCTDVSRIQAAWGSCEHWNIHDRIRIQNECPRCTYQPHNEIYEQVILNDSMTHKFI
jgi:hypothetical protein